jgi:hypothetical protein
MNPQELIDTSNQLITERYEWDRIWAVIARLVLPMQDRAFNMGSAATTAINAVQGWAAGPTSVDKLAERFDITGLIAVERLATGITSLVTPDSEKWQELGLTDEIGGSVEANDAEKRWLETQRDYLFNARYNPLTGWAAANQSAIRSMCAFGTGLYLVEESYGERGQSDVVVPFRSSPLPLSENYLTVNGQGLLDQDYRRFRLSARQVVQRFGTASPKTLKLANDPRTSHTQIEILHHVAFRQEKGMNNDPMARSMVSSIYLEVAEKFVLRRGGFNYWPIIAYHWNQVPHSAYGESPVMLVLGEIKTANIHGKNEVLSSQQLTRPPVGTADDSSMGKPNMNPGAINYGAIDANGRAKIQPLITAQDPSLVQQVRAASQLQIKEGLYTNLWQILINNPQMTATEALIRANEKGELLGPVGTKIQQGLSQNTDAELTILEGKGAWRQGSKLEPPGSLGGKNLRPKFNSPLDRIRRSTELVGVRQTLEIAGALAQAGRPDVLDKIDADAILDLSQEITGAPRKMFVKDEVLKQVREQRQQQQQMQQMTEMARAAGEAGNEVVPAIKGMQEIADGSGAMQGGAR